MQQRRPAGGHRRARLRAASSGAARPPASSATTVQQVVSTQMPAMLVMGTPDEATAVFTAVPIAAHQSAGFCSAQPG
jgi:hypothetical protein